ncbi:MAG: hypothetical protein Q9184_004307, partial [Pyrenodesmia sp. 2 TL-2023]
MLRYPGARPHIGDATRPIANDALSGLLPEGSASEDRISPFSTPPSSDENPNSGAISHEISLGRPPQKQDVTPFNPMKGRSRQAPNHISETEHPGQQQSLVINARAEIDLGSHAGPPGLPPRPEVTPRPVSIQSKPAPTPKSSTLMSDGNGSSTAPNAKSATHAERMNSYKTSRKSLQPIASLATPRSPTTSVTLRASEPNQDSRTDTIPSNPSMRRITQGPTGNSHSPDMTTSSGGYVTNDSPDNTSFNRRAPSITGHSHVIHANYDSKLFDMCSGRACSAGQLTRVWDLASGKLLLSLTLGEREVKATAVAFKPAARPEEEGSRLWIGTNHGSLHEIDVTSHRTVFSGLSPHQGREVSRIHRYQNTMWTLDEDGTLHVWPPDGTGLPTMESRPVTWKLPKGHSFSMAVKGVLWVAVGRQIMVFRPSTNHLSDFKVTQRPLIDPGAGEITSGAVIGNQLDRIYFSHSDGNVTIYSVAEYACLGVVNASVYKINCLVGTGTHLWAGYNTGKICVYDTKSQPWKTVKEWHAHEGPVANLAIDRTGLWISGLLRVGSVSLDNTIKLWDGLLEESWLESEMQDTDSSWCSFREIEAAVMTWNAGASTPASLRYEGQEPNMLRTVLHPGRAPDLLVFGFQELVDLEDKRLTAKTLFKGAKKKDMNDHDHMSRQYRDWRDHLVRSIEDYMPTKDSYALLHTASLVGLFSCVFVKASQRTSISNVQAAEIKRGMGGLHGNKTMHRNNDVAAILESLPFPSERDTTVCRNSFVGGGDGSMVLDHEICILSGDLNYRIDTMSRDTVIKAINTRNLDKLLERDQLLVSRRKNPTFGLKAFAELPIEFEPTYKYDVGSDTYDSSEKHRAPAWCDRILYRGPRKIKQLDYRRHELRTSDHRPVSGNFRLRVKSIIPDRQERAWQACQRKFEAMRASVERETKTSIVRETSTFLTALAAQERRVLKLQEELEKEEGTLSRLKKQWFIKKENDFRPQEPLQQLKTAYRASTKVVKTPDDGKISSNSLHLRLS